MRKPMTPPPHPATGLLGRLRRLSTWGFLVGPAGMHLNFGASQPDGRGLTTGQYSLWIQCRSDVRQRGKVLYYSLYPTEPDAASLESLIGGRRVLRVAVDPVDSSLRILYARDMIFSVFPGPFDGLYCWSVFDHSTRPKFYFFVWVDGFKGGWPPEERPARKPRPQQV